MGRSERSYGWDNHPVCTDVTMNVWAISCDGNDEGKRVSERKKFPEANHVWFSLQGTRNQTKK